MLAVMALLHALLIAVSLAIQPLGGRVDALEHRRSIHRGQFNAVVRGLVELAPSDGPQLLVVGASNALLGFRPDEIEALLPGTRVHNLATASMRADEMRDLVQTAWNLESEVQRKQTTFVAALLFASFPGPRSVYVRRSDGIAAEVRRSGLFDESRDGFVPRWDRRAVRLAALLERPLALADAVRDESTLATYGLRSFFSAAYFERKLDAARLLRSDPSDMMLFPRADGPEGRAASLAFFQAALPGGVDALDPAQVDQVVALTRWATERNVHLVLVAMPSPQWVRDGLPFYGRYAAALDRIADASRGAATVHFVDLTNADVPLWDASHPEPQGTRAWAEALVAALPAERPIAGNARASAAEAR